MVTFIFMLVYIIVSKKVFWVDFHLMAIFSKIAFSKRRAH